MSDCGAIVNKVLAGRAQATKADFAKGRHGMISHEYDGQRSKSGG